MSTIYSMPTGAVPGKTLQCMAVREHRVNRPIVPPPFRRSRTSEYIEPVLEPLAHELIDRCAGSRLALAELDTALTILLSRPLTAAAPR
ncbi:hypothetical protein [Prescottella sp. R16]|uniref:hypothetical protein n=1 Tax=Prescottella sp. R16 TaxID=3064529 RepID=UPI00272EBA53|nr:hypothetical protein [Prescottella sp. R16]